MSLSCILLTISLSVASNTVDKAVEVKIDITSILLVRISRSDTIHLSALSLRFRGSNCAGVVTKANVFKFRASVSFAICVIAPVPQPPPSPATRTIVSVPHSSAIISSSLSFAAIRPMQVLTAPRPLHVYFPICKNGAFEADFAFISVSIFNVQLLSKPESIKAFNIFLPAPPIPITLQVIISPFHYPSSFKWDSTHISNSEG